MRAERIVLCFLYGAIVISPGCASATTKISDRGQLYLSISYANRKAWVKKSFVPQNRYGISLRHDPTGINEPVTILEITHEIGGNRLMFSRENGETYYLAIDAESVDRLEEVIQEYFYLDEPTAAGADSPAAGLRNLIVLRDNTPIKMRPDVAGETIAAVNAGGRLSPVDPDGGGRIENWWRVRADSTTVGWVHEQFVSEPVPAGGMEERVIRSQAVRAAREMEKLSQAELARKEAEREALEAQIKPQWPYAVRDAIRHSRLVEGMSQEMVKLSLGFPDDIVWTTTANGTDEMWVFKDGQAQYKAVFFERDRLVRWQE